MNDIPCAHSQLFRAYYTNSGHPVSAPTWECEWCGQQLHAEEIK